MEPVRMDDKAEVVTLEPMRLDEVEGGQALAPIDLKPEPLGRTVEGAIAELERDFGADPMAPEDYADMAGVYPPEDQQSGFAIDDKQLRLAGLLVGYNQEDSEGFRLALSAALKRIRLQGDLAGYDQSHSGRSAAALDAIAGKRHGFKPARLMYRLSYQTGFDRWWTTFGHDDQRSKWTKWCCPGPKERADDISYWIVIRGRWHCYRPVNGKLEIQIYADIPSDAQPEEVIGDDWHVFEGIPQIRIAEQKRQVIKNDCDLLFSALGGRHGRGNLMFGEWIQHMLSLGQMKTKIDDDGDDTGAGDTTFMTVMKIIGMIGAGVAVLAGLSQMPTFLTMMGF